MFYIGTLNPGYLSAWAILQGTGAPDSGDIQDNSVTQNTDKISV